MIQIKANWETFKLAKGILKHRQANGLFYLIKSDGDFTWEATISDLGAEAEDFIDNYKEISDMNSLKYKTKNDDGVIYVSDEIDYSKDGVKRISVDMCDKRSWWLEAELRTSQGLIDSGDRTKYYFNSQDVVTDHFNSQRGSSAPRPLNIYVGGQLKTEWTDYEVNFRKPYTSENNLEVIFSEQLPVDSVVTSDFYEATTSDYILTPDTGYMIKLKYVELQISEGAILNDAILFEPGVNYAATGNTDYYPQGKGTIYYRAHDFINSNTEVMVGRPFGELTVPFNVLPEQYLTGYLVFPRGIEPAGKNSFNLLRCRLKNNRPITNCEIATATFYCTQEDLE